MVSLEQARVLFVLGVALGAGLALALPEVVRWLDEKREDKALSLRELALRVAYLSPKQKD